MGAHHIVGVSREFIGRYGRVEPGARSRARAARARRARDLRRDVRARPRDDRARDVEPAAVGARLSRSRARPRAGDARARAVAAAATDARLRACRHEGSTCTAARAEALAHRRRDHRALPRVRVAAGGRVEPVVPGRRALAAAGRCRKGSTQLEGQPRRAAGHWHPAWCAPAFLALLAEMLLRSRAASTRGSRRSTKAWHTRSGRSKAVHLAELHRARGELLRAPAMPRAAEDKSAKAIEYATSSRRNRSSCVPRLRSRDLLASGGRRPDAQAVLRPVYDWFREGHGTADLTAARAVLDALQ